MVDFHDRLHLHQICIEELIPDARSLQQLFHQSVRINVEISLRLFKSISELGVESLVIVCCFCKEYPYIFGSGFTYPLLVNALLKNWWVCI